ncbi:hypothetical protein [Variovorax sp. YR752]|uniref:hypothetical protein n=1 Tax=Variovorax sp. YR752 TaxID=1884383 RepID=UPI003137F541
MPAIAATTAPRTAPTELVATPTRTQRHRCEHRDEEDSDGARRAEAPARRGNALVSAMMSALKELMPASTAEAEDGAALKDSAMAFAHELVDALRSSGRGMALGHAHHPHRHGGDRHGGYDNLAQRLDRLAAQVDAPAAAATGTTTISASLSSASFSASVDGDTASASLSVTTLQIDLTQQTAMASTESPLQAAFRKLFEALQPASAPGTPAGEAAASSSLSSFLRQLAGALRGSDDGSAMQTPTRGGLLSLAA